MSEAGIEKSAALLLALGEEATAAVFRYLSPLEVSRLGQAMRTLEVLPRERVRTVLRDFSQEAAEQTGFATDTARFLDDALKQAWPPERAQAMLRRLGAVKAQTLENLAWRDPAELAGLLENPPPTLAAAVVAHLPRDLAAATLDLLPAATRAAILAELAHRDAQAGDALGELDDWLSSLVASTAPETGEATAANLLDRMSGGAAAATLVQIESVDAGLAARLRARVIEFDDLARAPQDGLRIFLRHVGARTLLLALKGSDGRVLSALSAVMSPAAALRMKDDLDTLGAVPVSEIQAAQAEAATTLRALVAEGTIRFEEEALA